MIFEVKEARVASTIFAACFCLLLVPAALAAGPDDAAAPVYKFINAFNTGDMNTAFALCSAGEVAIVDEFPPFEWAGSKAAQHWAAVMHAEAGGWKIRSWTWSGVTPHPAR